jgi:asparagine synthase (glutamine-hydrolysing)
MCGICGFIASSGNDLPESLLLGMNERITRRGPDGAGHFHNGKVGLAMRRLAIIDLEGGRQPIFNETGTMAIVFNGEIYNYRELRERLLKLGHEFSTHSDTEAILHLYEEYGLDAPNHLAGMFAFAIWDSERNRVVLARDRLGIKPLFYSRLPQGTLFGSEMKCLLGTGFVPDEPDWQALDQYLTYTNIPCPRTIYSHIRQLEPGTTCTIGLDGSFQTQRYWSVPVADEEPRSEQQWIADAERSLRQAVESHLVSDVPVGAFLSGGVDSGVMVALMADILGKPVETFTVGFGDAGSSFIDERQYSRALVGKYGLNHHEIDVKPDLTSILWEIVEAFDQPFADDSVVPSYYVSQVAGKHVKVALTGLGGDELFGGYRRHLGLQLGDSYARLPAWVRNAIQYTVRQLPESRSSSDVMDHLKRFARSGGASPPARYQDSLTSLPWLQRRALYSPGVAERMQPNVSESVILNAFAFGDRGSSLERALRTDLQTYLVDDILTLTDRLSMWHSLELRVPYLDHPLVELTARIPSNLKIRGTQQKYLLKKIAERWLPHDMIYHKKQGFEAPMGRWLRGPLLGFFDSIVNRASVERAGVFRFDEIARLRQEHIDGRRKHSKILFSILMLQAWQQRQPLFSGA